MGLFDRGKKDDKKKEEKKADFSNVKSGSSTAAKPEAKTATAAAAARSYTVKSGDSLWKISEQMYGNGNDWRRIFEANKDRIKDPDVIQPGWVLNIPAQSSSQGESK